MQSTYTIEPLQYVTLDAGNLYAFCVERCARLLNASGWFGMIVPSSAVGLDETNCLRDMLSERYPLLFVSTYSIRPAKLFEGVDQRLCIILGGGSQPSAALVATRYHHWNADERETLFPTLRYRASFIHPRLNRIAQVGDDRATTVLEKIERMANSVIGDRYSTRNRGFLAHYHRSPRYWIRAMDFEQYFKSDARSRSVHHFRDLAFSDEEEGKAACAAINSTLFFFWFMAVCNGRNLTNRDVSAFPLGVLATKARRTLVKVFDRLMCDYKTHSFIRRRADCEFQEFRPNLSKPIIDEIDGLLAEHYGFTAEELDFIVNYDIKYRLGASANDGSDS